MIFLIKKILSPVECFINLPRLNCSKSIFNHEMRNKWGSKGKKNSSFHFYPRFSSILNFIFTPHLDKKALREFASLLPIIVRQFFDASFAFNSVSCEFQSQFTWRGHTFRENSRYIFKKYIIFHFSQTVDCLWLKSSSEYSLFNLNFLLWTYFANNWNQWLIAWKNLTGDFQYKHVKCLSALKIFSKNKI